MKSIKLGKIVETYLVRIEREDQAIEKLEEFANNNLKTKDGKYRYAEFGGIGGGIKDIGGYFSQVNANVKEYSGPQELLNITGNITNLDGKPFVHTHATFGDRENSNPVESHRAWGFHLVKSAVGLTIELTITVYDTVVERSRDDEGLPLILSSTTTTGGENNKTDLEKENTELKKKNEQLNKALIEANKTAQQANTTNQQLIAQQLQRPPQ